MAKRIYLDWNATAPLRAEAREAMLGAMDLVGNPSSVHGEGRAARALIERARAQVAAAVGCKPVEVVFTSGATEAASVLAGLPDGAGVFVDDTAHDALWTHLNVGSGRSDGAGNTLVMGLANNETGVISSLPEKVDGRWPYGSTVGADWLLLDVTQAIGRMAFSFAWSGADFAVLSAHKLGGPKGVGALILREGLDINPLSIGGGQEMGRRAGTENLIGIAGFGAAAKAAVRDLADGVWENVAGLRDEMESYIAAQAPDTIFAGSHMPRLPNTSYMVTPGWKGETQVMVMDLAGYAVSAGSACSSGRVRPSRVLQAMGFDDLASASAIRVSIGPTTKQEDVMQFADAWIAAYRKFNARAA